MMPCLAVGKNTDLRGLDNYFSCVLSACSLTFRVSWFSHLQNEYKIVFGVHLYRAHTQRAMATQIYLHISAYQVLYRS